LLHLLNTHRVHARLDPLDEAVFIRTIGGEAACVQTLQAGMHYAARDYDFNPCGGSTRCTLTRDMIKRGIAHALLGHFPHPAQNIRYDSGDLANLFPLHLRNYFADAAHDDHRVTVEQHWLNQDDLSPQAPFRAFSFRPGELIGEVEELVPVVPIWDTLFSALPLPDPRGSLRHRHLDLMMAGQVIRWDIPAAAAVLVSDFQSTSTAFGQAIQTAGQQRQLLFLDLHHYSHNEYQQYDWVNVQHELTKARAGFSAVPRGRAIETLWMAGSNDPALRLLIQLLAAAETGHELVFRLAQDFIRMPHELIAFLTQVTKYHPQTVLRAMHTFLPLLTRLRQHLSEPAVAAGFLKQLADEPAYQPPPPPPPPQAAHLPAMHYYPQETMQRPLVSSPHYQAILASYPPPPPPASWPRAPPPSQAAPGIPGHSPGPAIPYSPCAPMPPQAAPPPSVPAIPPQAIMAPSAPSHQQKMMEEGYPMPPTMAPSSWQRNPSHPKAAFVV
jgi:hypothetical protein